MSLVHPSATSPRQKKRMRACGRTVTYHRESGKIEAGHFKCNVRWCAYCQRQYRNHVFGCLRASVSDSPNLVMLTLTAPPPMAGLGRGALESALKRQRDLWKEASSQIRWWKWRRDRNRPGGLEPPRFKPTNLHPEGMPHPDFTNTYANGAWEGPEAADGYAWALEVTTGKGGRIWHVHRHVLCSSLAVAERINAAWQSAGAELGISGRGWSQTDLKSMDGGGAAWYLASYISSKNEPGRIPPRRHKDYTAVMRDTQRHNAGGSFRPLGISRPPPDDPVLAVELPGYPGQYVEPAEFYSGTDAVWDRISGPVDQMDWSIERPAEPRPTPERIAWLATLKARRAGSDGGKDSPDLAHHKPPD